MADARTLTEDEVASGIYSCLITTLKVSKNNGLLDSTDWIGGEEERLVVCGLELLLLYAAKSETASPSIPLPCPEDSDRRLDASTCPHGLCPYFDRWAGTAPRLRCLPQDHTRDLTLLICRKPPITLPKEVPDPFPFFPTPEQQAREEARDLVFKLSIISNALSTHLSFTSHWRGKLWAALSEENDVSLSNQASTPIARIMTRSQVIMVLGQYHCPEISHKLDLASFSDCPITPGRLNPIYRGRLHNNTLVAVKVFRIFIDLNTENIIRLKHAARELYARSKCNHPNVRVLIGMAQFRNQIALVSPWMESNNIRDYVNKRPGVDRFNLDIGLAYMHSIGIIHGNLKGVRRPTQPARIAALPFSQSNVLLSSLGVPVLSGFINIITRTSTVQFLETETDRFSLPARWMETMIGERPYSELKSEPAVVHAVVLRKRLPVRPLKQIPLDNSQGDMLWTLLTKCWQHEPDQRPTAEQVYKHMKPFVVDSTMVASEIIAHLGSRNCPDLSDQLDEELCSRHPLSNGGYGDVYRGSLKSGESVALKSMIDTARELYTWSKCQHAHVAKLLGLAMFRNQIAMVSPWMENGSMMSYIERNPSADRCQLCAQVAEGLTYLHHIDLIHGDVKAANVLISDQGVAMLTDFGNSILKLSTLRFAGTDTGCKISVRWTVC
ncbi:hypothetical protein FRC07_008064 [Ceratobasidium sp. 392]|nr:hypothetical protein FRC07_008064 [Ceratobasidium sp. 392]